jgi:hypothetical protein
VALHPSPDVVLPSSHCSVHCIIPFPHTGGVFIIATHPSGSKIYPVAVSDVVLSVKLVSKLFIYVLFIVFISTHAMRWKTVPFRICSTCP